MQLCKYELGQLGHGLNDTEFAFDCRGGQKVCLFSTASRQALGPTQPRIQLMSGSYFFGGKVTNHLHLMPRLRMRGLKPPLPHPFALCGA
jgi:hypothetical protein